MEKYNYHIGLGLILIGIFAPWMIVPGLVIMAIPHLEVLKQNKDLKKDVDALRAEFNQIKTTVAIHGRKG